MNISTRTNYSYLFNSLNSSSSSSSNIFNSINLSDYSSIKSGSYGKLLRSYYSSAASSSTTDRTESNSIDKSKLTYDASGSYSDVSSLLTSMYDTTA